jgi:SAM-dependent methyltransferase
MSIFRCVGCGSGSLQPAGSRFQCDGCLATYPIRAGVPLFLSEVEVRPSNLALSDEVLAGVCRSAALPDDPPTRAALRGIFGSSYHLPELALDAENNYYFNRVGLQGGGHRPQLTSPGGGVVGYAITHHHIPARLPCAAQMSWNVRLENRGESTIPAGGRAPARLSYRWRDADGMLTLPAAEPTELPVDVRPGRGMSVPLWLRTPRRPGSYTLEVLLGRNEEWLEDGALLLPVRVMSVWDGYAPRRWRRLDRPQETYSYLQDHELGRAFLREELTRRGWVSPRMLEVGGCSNPMLWDFPGEVYTLDIDVQTVQVGALRFGRTHPNIHFLAADANRLPFHDGAFDCAVLFATLHHFIDPIACLRELRRVVKPGGFVGLSSEPIGSYRAATLSAQFRAELEQGINEQIFTPEEYVQMFRQVGLSGRRVEIDRGSLRAILGGRMFGERLQAKLWGLRCELRRLAKGLLRRVGVRRLLPGR